MLSLKTGSKVAASFKLPKEPSKTKAGKSRFSYGSALPCHSACYLLGLTNTRLITYVLSTAIGTLPGDFADTYVGVIGQDLASGQQIAYVAAGAVVTLAGAILITWKARAALKEQGVRA